MKEDEPKKKKEDEEVAVTSTERKPDILNAHLFWTFLLSSGPRQLCEIFDHMSQRDTSHSHNPKLNTWKSFSRW